VNPEITEVAGLERLLEEMIAAQRERLLALARRLAPELAPDDLLQPHDHPALAASPDFNFEDGILAGYLALRAALRASCRK
jgi:hypothetical protein